MKATSSLEYVCEEDFYLSPPPRDLISLVSSALDGDSIALERLSTFLLPIIKKIVCLWNRSYYKPMGMYIIDEDDDVQNALIRLLYGDRLAKGDYASHTSPLCEWVNYEGRRKSFFKYAQYNILKYVRDLRRAERPILMGENLPDPADDTPSPETLTHHKRCISDCLASLSPAHRDVLNRKSILNQTQSQMAQDIEVAETTISRWLSKAIVCFKECLTMNCPDALSTVKF